LAEPSGGILKPAPVKYLSARLVALLCVLSCASVAAIGVWPAHRDIQTVDQNGDGRPDVWRTYDSRGQLTKIEVDSNYDGSPDIQEYYQQGFLVRRESDRNFNGQTDLVEDFDPQTHGQTRSVVDIDYDGTADILVLFRDGRPVFSRRAAAPRHSVPELQRVPVVDHRGTAQLVPLADPFESDASIRGTSITSTEEGSIGLSTSGGLPHPRFVALAHLSASARLLADDTCSHALTLLRSRPSRAPPAS
jgi:hypothetical protein